MTPHSISSCLNDDYQACLASYTRLIGTDMTPNYMDSGHSNFTISPWCTCRGSGNQEEECEKFLQDFRENTCLRNAIQAFGYGSLPKPDPQPTTGSAKPDLEPTAIVSKTTMEPGEEPCIISSCANLNAGLGITVIFEGEIQRGRFARSSRIVTRQEAKWERERGELNKAINAD
ncbi:GDNF family receptor alpha-2 [Labeo rohita]|uniref:GDNF family receptor alpha-2 n=1 Tax=Labeo rohita TaxID=84645 RepID=A0ABQ8MF23_LABRO|nr:GDNF family receptor alpha-2 [Labeo rohita]